MKFGQKPAACQVLQHTKRKSGAANATAGQAQRRLVLLQRGLMVIAQRAIMAMSNRCRAPGTVYRLELVPQSAGSGRYWTRYRWLVR
jgi:hypothetical protein